MGANRLARWVPWLISGTAVLNVAVGLMVHNPTGGMVADGLVGSVGDDPERASPRLGGWLLLVSAHVVVLMPAPGGWLVAALGCPPPLGRQGGRARRGRRSILERRVLG